MGEVSNIKYCKLYKINLLFGLILFFVTILLRGELVYSVFHYWAIALSILNVWNWLMLLSLGIAAIQTINLTYKFGGVLNCLLCILVIVFLIIATIGIFIVAEGELLS